MRKCGGKKEGGREEGRMEGGDEMCIPQQGRDTASMCVCVLGGNLIQCLKHG